MTRWRIADASLVRARLATAYLRVTEVPSTIGGIRLRGHQRDAAARLRVALERFGGALLADDVGLGKTYTALAASAAFGRLLIVGPASLAAMWREALGNVGREAEFVSFESLSRGRPATSDSNGVRAIHQAAYDLVIVDEAHHARNPATRRYARLAALTAGAHVLLLSATPVHNATRDLHALLALFAGTRAGEMSLHDLSSCVVRRTRADVPVAITPARASAVWLETPADADVLDAILRIPAPCPPRDGADASALLTLGLVRAWSSTDAALRAALRRRLARADSLRDALLAGRHPTRAELVAWVVGDDATQLAFPELVASASGGVAPELLASVSAHADGVSSTLRILARSEGVADDARRELIRSVRARHGGLATVVFSQYAESVHAMYRRLAGDGRVCAVTAAGAVVAGGPLSRAEALARFAPFASGGRSPPRAELIELLIATDLLSEGLNLQDAAVVVHLDLPWTPARLTQRMGRVWRIGSRHESVFEYVFAPPAPGARASAIIERLRRKAAQSRIAVGGETTPIDTPRPGARSDAAGVAEDIRAALAAWTRRADHGLSANEHAGATSSGQSHALVAAIESTLDGWLALVADGGTLALVGRCDRVGPTRDPPTIRDLVNAANGPSTSGRDTSIEGVLREIAEHLDSATAARDAGLERFGSLAHERVAARIASVVTAAPPHRRTIVARLASAARAAVTRVQGVGGEDMLTALAADYDPDAPRDRGEDWLSRVAGLASSARFRGSLSTQAPDPTVIAVLVLRSRTPGVGRLGPGRTQP